MSRHEMADFILNIIYLKHISDYIAEVLMLSRVREVHSEQQYLQAYDVRGIQFSRVVIRSHQSWKHYSRQSWKHYSRSKNKPPLLKITLKLVNILKSILNTIQNRFYFILRRIRGVHFRQQEAYVQAYYVKGVWFSGVSQEFGVISPLFVTIETMTGILYLKILKILDIKS